MITGYLRVSTSKQNLANQQDEIRRFAESRQLTIDNWVTEVASGKKHERDRKLGGLLRRMKRGDTIIVTEISRLSRTLTDVMAIMGLSKSTFTRPRRNTVSTTASTAKFSVLHLGWWQKSNAT